LENLLGIYCNPNSLTFFVHGWNAWGFCGAIRKGELVPLYAMPHFCVHGFHGGGPALNINLGKTPDLMKTSHFTYRRQFF
jgi:hypothetical protein